MDNKNIYQRFIDVQKRVQTVVKNEKVEVSSERSYKAVSHDDVASLLHLPLAEAGIVMLPNVVSFSTTEFDIQKQGYGGKPGYVQRWYRTDLTINVKWINADNPSDFFESTGAAFALDTSDKSFAKAYSLALKIVLLKVHLLESRDDEEKRTFEGETEPKIDPQPKKQTKPQPPPQNKKEPIPFTKPVEQKKIDASQYIMPLGMADVLGKKLIEIPPTKVKLIKQWAEDECKKIPLPQNIEKIKEILENVSAFLNSVG